MKVLITILSCQNEPYPRLQETIKNTYASHHVDGVEIVYYYGLPRQSNTYNELYLPIPEKHANIGYKTAYAFEYFLKKEFDYLFRVNCSCYVDQERLVEWLEDKPREEFYAGVEADYGIRFMHGSGYILSRDVVVLVVNNKWSLDSTIADDVALGKLLIDLDIPFYNKFGHACFGFNSNDTYDIFKIVDGIETRYTNLTKIKKEYFNGAFHIRCKHPIDRTIDIQLMNLTHKLLS